MSLRAHTRARRRHPDQAIGFGGQVIGFLVLIMAGAVEFMRRH